MWAIANIAGDSKIYRDQALELKALDYIVEILAKTNDRHVMKIGIWALSNLCRGQDPPAFSKVYKSVNSFVSALKSETNKEVIIDSIWSLAQITDEGTEAINFCLKTDIVPAVA